MTLTRAVYGFPRSLPRSGQLRPQRRGLHARVLFVVLALGGGGGLNRGALEASPNLLLDGEDQPNATEVVGGTLLPMSVLALAAGVEKALVVDLGANRMFEVRHGADGIHVARDFYVAIGKQGSDKRYEGDEKTPVGVYTVVSHIPGEKLPPIYGVGALPMDYPSPWDKYLDRTGSGIWIHGTNKSDDELLPRSSRGCLTLRNSDFEIVLDEVSVGATPVIVANSVDWQPASAIEAVRDELLQQVERWRRDWESLDTLSYLSHYHEDFRSGSMGIDRWRSHKSRVNTNKKFIKVELSDISAFRYPGEDDLYVVRFTQSYRSNNFNGQSTKQQYWKRDESGWKILVEGR